MPHANLIEFFTADHRTCDAIWAAIEGGESAAFPRFRAELEQHFTMEEQVLFPAFELATGMTSGPTTMMRMEHEQVRGLLGQMQTAFAAGDEELLLDLGDTLLMVLQQHNQKEEGMLYPLAQAHIPEPWPALKAKLDAVRVV